MSEQQTKIEDLISTTTSVLIMQADNPDADSLASSLALEQILEEAGKQTYMYCSVDMPSYLRYLVGWDRVSSEIPNNFDLAIIVDASTTSLFGILDVSSVRKKFHDKPCIVLDHHSAVENEIDFADILVCDDQKSSTGELIYSLFSNSRFKVNLEAQEYVMTAILGDTQGLTNQLATADTYQVMSDIIRAGVDRPALEELRRSYSKMSVDILKYKAVLIERAKFASGGRLAYLTIPQAEIIKYSPQYNPGPLVQPDLLNTVGVDIAIVFKTYDDGRVTATIRSNSAAPIAADLATYFGGGGHVYASGFKQNAVQNKEGLINECISKAEQLLKGSE